MALIHERLYQSHDVAAINLADYVRELTDHLRATMLDAGTVAVGLSLQTKGVTLDIRTAIPCGLIITELVTNALKYAFPPGWGGVQPQIRVGLRTDANRIQLTVADNGVGLPPNLDWRKSSSLGLRLVNLLTMQIDGALELQRDAGAAWAITFGRPESGE
jgi:two-component sensor histidine kinase